MNGKAQSREAHIIDKVILVTGKSTRFKTSIGKYLAFPRTLFPEVCSYLCGKYHCLFTLRIYERRQLPYARPDILGDQGQTAYVSTYVASVILSDAILIVHDLVFCQKSKTYDLHCSILQ
jgi:hypothetical protein